MVLNGAGGPDDGLWGLNPLLVMARLNEGRRLGLDLGMLTRRSRLAPIGP